MWEIHDSKLGEMLVVNGEPPISVESMAHAARVLNIYERPETAAGESVLQELLREFAIVLVNDPSWRDVAFVEDSRKLEEVDFWPQPDRSPSLSPDSPLRGFAGCAFPEWRSLGSHSRIRQVYLQGGDFSWVERSSWQLEGLTLSRARRVTEIPPSARMARLEQLTVNGCRSLDATRLGQSLNLRHVAFRSIGSLRLPETWPEGLRIEKMVLEDVRAIVNPETLLTAPIDAIRVISDRRIPFDSEFVRQAKERSRPSWVGKGFS